MENAEVTGKVIKVMPYGAFVKLDKGKVGLIHISQFTDKANETENIPLKEGDRVVVKVNGERNGKLNLLFMRRIVDQSPKHEHLKENFEQLMKKFLRDSQESLSEQNKRLKRHRGEAA